MSKLVKDSSDLKSFLNKNGIDTSKLSFNVFTYEDKERTWLCSNGVRIIRASDEIDHSQPMKVLHMIDDADNSEWNFLVNEQEATKQGETFDV